MMVEIPEPIGTPIGTLSLIEYLDNEMHKILASWETAD